MESYIKNTLTRLKFPFSQLPSKYRLMCDGVPLKTDTRPSDFVSVFGSKTKADGTDGGVYKITEVRKVPLCMWNLDNEITLMVLAKQENAKHIMPLDAIDLHHNSMELVFKMPTMLSLKQAMPQADQLLGSAAFAACFRQGLEGLFWLQERGYVHGDIHDGNIFFKTEQDCLVLVLGDFGSSKKCEPFGNGCDFFNRIEPLHFVSMYNPNDRQLGRDCGIKYDVFAFANLMGTQIFNKPLYKMARAADGLDEYNYQLQLKEIVKEDIIQTMIHIIRLRIKDPRVVTVLRKTLLEWDKRPDAGEALELLRTSGTTPVKSFLCPADTAFIKRVLRWVTLFYARIFRRITRIFARATPLA